jgi:hypothetical protein
MSRIVYSTALGAKAVRINRGILQFFQKFIGVKGNLARNYVRILQKGRSAGPQL